MVAQVETHRRINKAAASFATISIAVSASPSSTLPSGALGASPHDEPQQKRRTSPLGFQWVTYWLVLDTFFFFGGRFHLKQAPLQVIRAFLTPVPCSPDQEQELGLFLSTCVHVCFLRPVPTPRGARWDHPPYPSLRPPATPFAQITLSSLSVRVRRTPLVRNFKLRH